LPASPWLVGSIAPPLGPSLDPLFYQPDLPLFKCAKNSVRYLLRHYATMIQSLCT